MEDRSAGERLGADAVARDRRSAVQPGSKFALNAAVRFMVKSKRTGCETASGVRNRKRAATRNLIPSSFLLHPSCINCPADVLVAGGFVGTDDADEHVFPEQEVIAELFYEAEILDLAGALHVRPRARAREGIFADRDAVLAGRLNGQVAGG